MQKLARFLVKKLELLISSPLIQLKTPYLFIKVPIPYTIEIIKSSKQMSCDPIPLIKHCLISTYFSYKFYKQIADVVMGFPIFLIIAFKEQFEILTPSGNLEKNPYYGFIM